MVKKANGKWGMCTDYTDLNKACSIDRLVDGASGYALLSFMDAYSRYNQIKMYPQDESKTAFITDVGAYYYKVIMPFGLKNAGATYQRLMDCIFEGLIGGDVEVYVDDMVVKLVIAPDRCRALGRVFQVLRKYQLKLNPEKCSFSHHQHEKPTDGWRGATTHWENHNTLTILIPIDRDGRPNIQYPKKRRLIHLDEERRSIFETKSTASHSPTLTKPTPRIPLLIYISVADEAVSVVMNAEKRYKRIEKAALALVVASRRLRPYFQGHLIIVRTDLPIKQVLRKPDLAKRMVTWSVQLSEFDISYKSRGHIKAQALANFIMKMTMESTEKEVKGRWFLSMDGASNQTGSGAGVILEGPNGVLIKKLLHFEFKASNNQAEYEVLLAEMRLAKELEARALTAKSDSKLITGQVNGEYQVKDPQLMKYLDKATKMAATFEKFTLLHVLREQNEKADLLSKLATSQKRGV
ncbi:Retrovirus-related Pol polyprotein from transposon 17.6, partial [Mucuna pruriens]